MFLGLATLSITPDDYRLPKLRLRPIIAPNSGVGTPNLTYERRRSYEEVFGSGAFGGPWHCRFSSHAVSRSTRRKGITPLGAENRGVLGNLRSCENRTVLCDRRGPYLLRPCPFEVRQLG